MDYSTVSNIDLIKFYRAGDKEALAALTENNKKLVYSFSKPYVRTFPYLQDDIHSVGNIGLLKAIYAFDLDKGRSLSTLAYRAIINEIRAFLRDEKLLIVGKNRNKEDTSSQNKKKEKPYIKVFSYDEIISDDGETSQLDLIPDESVNIEEDIVSNIGFDDLFNFVISTLDPDELHMFMNLTSAYDQKFTQQEYAEEELGISQEYTGRIFYRLLYELRSKIIAEPRFSEAYALTTKDLGKDVKASVTTKRLGKHRTKAQSTRQAIEEEQKKMLNFQNLKDDYNMSIDALEKKYSKTFEVINEAGISMGLGDYFAYNMLATEDEARVLVADSGLPGMGALLDAGLITCIIKNKRYTKLHDLWDYFWKFRRKCQIADIRKDYPYPDDEYISAIRNNRSKFIRKKE